MIAESVDPIPTSVAPERRSSSPCMAKLDRLEWATCDWFAIQDYRFGVRSTSAGFGEWVRYALASYRAEGPLDANADPLYALIVEDGARPSGRGSKNLHLFYYGTFGVVRTLDIMAIARSFLSEIESLTYPIRDDAVYLEASVIRGRGKTVLIPSLMVPDVSAVGRRLRSSTDLALPSHMSVALEPGTGHLIPAARTLDIPDDALDVVGRYVPIGSEKEDRALIDRELSIDRVVMMANSGGPGLRPASRGPVLYELSKSIRNLARVGSGGVTTVASMVADADVVMGGWGTSKQLTDLLTAAIDGGRYVPDRTEGTPGEP